MTVISGLTASRAASTGSLPSVEPSSTMMISISPVSPARMLATARGKKSFWLKCGITTVSRFSGRDDWFGSAAIKSDIISYRNRPRSIIRSARRDTDATWREARRRSFKENKFVVAGIAALFENKIPFLGRVKRAAGQLPVHQVDLFALVAIGLDADVFGAATDALDFP